MQRLQCSFGSCLIGFMMMSAGVLGSLSLHSHDGGVVDPDGLSLSDLVAYHRDSAVEHMRVLMNGRALSVYGGCVPALAIERLELELSLSPEQQLSLWRSYHTYADRVAEPLRQAEQEYFYSEGDRYKAAFPEMLPGADLSHLEPVIANRFRQLQSRFEREQATYRRPPEEWRRPDSGTWLGDWSIAVSIGHEIGRWGDEYQRIVRRISSESAAQLRESDIGIEVPAREALIAAIPTILAERQRSAWEEHSQHTFSLNAFVGNRMTHTYRRDRMGLAAMVELSDRMDLWAIVDEATREDAELGRWRRILQPTGEASVDCEISESLARIWSSTVLALADITRESDRDRMSLNEARVQAVTGENVSRRSVTELVRRNQRFQQIVQGFLVSMSSELHRHLAPEDVEVFQDRVRAGRFEGLYSPDTMDVIMDTLRRIEREDDDSVLGEEVRDAVAMRTSEYIAERRRLRAEIADHAYRMRLELRGAFSDPKHQPWIQLRRMLVKWMEYEVSTSQEIYDLLEDQSLVAIIETVVSRSGRLAWLKPELARLQRFLAEL